MIMDPNILNQQHKQFKIKICQIILDYTSKNPEPIYFQKIIYQLFNNKPDHIFSIYGIENGVILYDTPIVFSDIIISDLNDLSVETLIKVTEELSFFQVQKILKEKNEIL